MKLKEWAEKTGVKYLTAYRWFKAGTLPVKAYQTDSGTIIVEEELESEKQEKKLINNNAMSVFLKKTVEFSKNNASVEDFAAWILANFSLKPIDDSETPKYSRVMPKPEEVQKHFQQFLPKKGEKPKPQMFVAPPEALEEIAEQEHWTLSGDVSGATTAPAVDASKIDTVVMSEDMSVLLSSGPVATSVKMYGNVAEGVVTRSVDSTPQLNYTGSESSTLGNFFVADTVPTIGGITSSVCNNNPYSTSYPSIMYANQTYTSGDAYNTFGPTQKELDATKSFEVTERPRRGRKPKNRK